MTDQLDVIDVVYPSGAVGPVLRIRDGSKIRLFTLSEIGDDGILVERKLVASAIKKVFEDNTFPTY